MKVLISRLAWIVVAVLGAGAFGALAVHRNEPVNSAYILIAALCSYAIGYRFYSKWIAARILMLDDRRATPCEVHEDGKEYVKTNKWIVFGHHFAAISGPGPLVGPVLAAQFGYLPGTLWILIGVVLGGAVQDFVILFSSMRRDGKSLGQMVREELNKTGGVIATAAILAIMTILLAVLALVVVKALAESPWGVFTVAATIPIAIFMGGYLRFVRIGKVIEASVIGVVLLLLAVWGGQYVHEHPQWATAFTLKAEPLAWSIIIYGFAASVLPVWLLLAPRDYLSTFMKLGVIVALALGIFVVLPDLQMPPVTKFVDGSGLVVPGKVFPFCFITIACGAISGFHTLIASGITPKIVTRESYTRSIGYGAMCLESLVAIMAIIAACTLQPGVYMGMNVASKGPDSISKAADINAKIEATGAKNLNVVPQDMDQLAAAVGENTLYNRAGGAATLAVGMANIFSRVTAGKWVDLWYHFAIMFEALFILTTLDAGTRVGRYLIQDAFGNLWKPLGDVKSVPANLVASATIVAAWGYFLIQGVRDPEGGVKALWPLFGIANQLLASIALCLATTVILKMQLSQSGTRKPRPAYALITLLPLIWLLAVTTTAGVQKVFDAKPSIGFLAKAKQLQAQLPQLEQSLSAAELSNDSTAIATAAKAVKNNRREHTNQLVDAVAVMIFLSLVAAIVFLSLREWILLLARSKLAVLRETPPTWLPDYAVAEAKPLQVFTLLALLVALAKELSGEAAMERAECTHQCCATADGESKAKQQKAYVEATEKRFNGVSRCC